MPDSDDLWNIKQALEENPADHELRWKAAKQFYKACEYRHALEELQVLRNEWKPHLNVARYLAATYYRLGRYDEAKRELLRSCDIWPKEIVLQEQLARVHEVSGDLLESAKVWEGISAADPSHPMAEAAAKRLRKKVQGKYDEQKHDLELDSADSGINLRPGQTCPNCGAHNALDAELCWQCQSPIFSVRTPRPVSRHGTPTPSAETGRYIRYGAMALSVVLLSAAIYLSIRDLAASDSAVTSMSDFYQYTLAPTRVVLGAGIIILWPLTLFLVLFAVGMPRIPLDTVAVAGIILGCLTFLMSFSSPTGLAVGMGICLIMSVPVLLYTFQLQRKEVFSAWAYQTIILLVAAVGIVTISEWSRTQVFFNPVRDIPAVMKTADLPVSNPELAFSRKLVESMPVKLRLEWEGSESPWLSHYAELVTISVRPISESSTVSLEFLDNRGSTIGFYSNSRGDRSEAYPVVGGTPYTLLIESQDHASVEVTINGILPHRLLAPML